MHNEKNKIKKKPSMLKRISKYILIILGSIILLILSFGIWMYFSLIAGPGPMDISDYHPFKSAEAKEKYLAYEEEMARSWPFNSEEKLVSTTFGETFMRISGPIDAPPLILLPGGGSNSYIWNANIEELSSQYRTYALDNIYDWGRSVYTKEILNGQDYANWLNELTDSLQVDKVNMIGYSYGGWVVSQYALNYPEKLYHVILIAPAWTVLDVTKEWWTRTIKSLIPIRYYKKKIMYWVWADLANMNDEGEELVEDRIDYFTIAMESFKLKQGVQPTVLSDNELSGLNMPVLYLVGENETCYDGKEAVKRLNKMAPKIETKLINNTGHDLMFTHTETVNNLILEFLKND